MKLLTIEQFRDEIPEGKTEAFACLSSLNTEKTMTGLASQLRERSERTIPLLATGHLFQLISILHTAETSTKLSDPELALCSGLFSATTEQEHTLLELDTNRKTSSAVVLCGERGRKHPCLPFHKLLLSCTQQLGDSPAEYIKPQSTIQKQVLDGMLRLTRKLRTEVKMATDQCSLPTIAIPLKDIANLWLSLSPDARIAPQYASAAARVTYAIKFHHRQYAAPGTVEGALLTLTDGDIIMKTGENGLAAGIVFSKNTALAVKCENNCQKTAALAFMHLLCEQNLVKDSDKVAEAIETLGTLRSDRNKAIGTMQIS